MPTTHHHNTYTQLLAHRIAIGRQLIDFYSHLKDDTVLPRDLGVLERLLRRQDLLDARLSAFRRWSADTSAVFEAEEQRWHAPSVPPRDHDDAPCRFCRAKHIPAELVLPSARRSA